MQKKFCYFRGFVINQQHFLCYNDKFLTLILQLSIDSLDFGNLVDDCRQLEMVIKGRDWAEFGLIQDKFDSFMTQSLLRLLCNVCAYNFLYAITLANDVLITL
jgi:hypothetical protein